jgi:hypothetical protein
MDVLVNVGNHPFPGKTGFLPWVETVAVAMLAACPLARTGAPTSAYFSASGSSGGTGIGPP